MANGNNVNSEFAQLLDALPGLLKQAVKEGMTEGSKSGSSSVFGVKLDTLSPEEAIKQINEEAAARKSLISITQRQTVESQRLNAVLQVRQVQLEREIAKLKQKGSLNEEETKRLKALTKELERNAKAQDIAAKKLENFKNASAGTNEKLKMLARTVTGLNNTGWAKTITNVDKVKGAFHGLGKSIASVGLFGGVDAIAMIGKVVGGAILAVDTAQHSFAQATGAGTEYVGMLAEIRQETMGVKWEFSDVLPTIIALKNSYSSFNDIGEKTRLQLAKQLTVLDELGMSSQDSVRIMDSMEKSIGATREAAIGTVEEIYKMSSALGKAPKDLAAEFQQAAPQLAVYGGQMKSVFVKLEAQSKATGLSMSRLLATTGQFDTFQGAAAAAGTLNAFLGGPYLNTVELVGMKEDERIEAVRNSMKASGRSWEQMERFQKKGIAKALNMDVEEAGRLMRMSTTEASARRKEMDRAAATDIAFADRAKAIQPILRMMQLALKEIAMVLFKDFMGATGDGAEGIKNMQEKIQEWKEIIAGGQGKPGLIDKIKELASTIVNVLIGWAMFSMGAAIVKAIAGYVALAAAAKASAVTQIASNRAVAASIPMGRGPAGGLGKGVGATVGAGMGYMGYKGATDKSKSTGSRVASGLGGVLGMAGGIAMFVPGVGWAVGAGLMAAGAGLNVAGAAMDDFVYQGDDTGGTIQPINKNDSFLGVKSGGGVDAGLQSMVAILKEMNKVQKKNEEHLKEIAKHTSRPQVAMSSGESSLESSMYNYNKRASRGLNSGGR